MSCQIIPSKIQTATVMLPNLSRKERNHAGSGSEKESMPHNCSLYTHLCVTMRIYNVVAQESIPTASLPSKDTKGYHSSTERKPGHILQTVCTILKTNHPLLKC